MEGSILARETAFIFLLTLKWGIILVLLSPPPPASIPLAKCARSVLASPLLLLSLFFFFRPLSLKKKSGKRRNYFNKIFPSSTHQDCKMTPRAIRSCPSVVSRQQCRYRICLEYLHCCVQSVSSLCLWDFIDTSH